MNSWNITGEIVRYGIKGTKFQQLWIQARLALPKGLTIPENQVFINFPYDPNPSSKAGKTCAYINSQLSATNPCRFFFISDATVGPVKLNRKGEDGEWVTEEITGVRGKINHFHLSEKRFPEMNLGLIEGKILNIADMGEYSKFIISERYRNPQDNTWKSRDVPILALTADLPDVVVSRNLFLETALCGVTPSGESKVYGYSRKVIAT